MEERGGLSLRHVLKGLGQYKFSSACFTDDARGRWYFCVVLDCGPSQSAGVRAVAIDLGCKATATVSTGEKLPGRWYREQEAKLGIAQFSGRGRRSVPGQVTPVWQTGKDPLQKLNCKLVEKSASILVGNVKAIVKTQWIKSSLGTGWDMLKTLLKYKCEHPDVFVQWLYQSK